jgi:hypothetical protein
MQTRLLIIGISLFLFTCRGRKESVYVWNGEDESRKLTLLKNNTFILEIEADYYHRIDTGKFQMVGDTLIINPDKTGGEIERVEKVDSLFMEKRFLEVMEQEVIFDTTNSLVESYYRAQIFPNVMINNSIALEISPDDPSYKKLTIPESIKVQSITVTVLEENSCKPRLAYHMDNLNDTKSYRVFLRSRRNQENYLAGFKWILKGESIESFFSNEDCDPLDVKLVRTR